MVTRDRAESKAQLKVILMAHEGEARAITGRQLAGGLGQKDDRRVRLIIRELIAEGLPIAANTQTPPGYFVVTTRQEAEQYASSIRRRLIKDALRRRDFRRAADQHLTPAKQGKLI